MPLIKSSKRSKAPRKPFDKDRLIDEMKLVGHYGLKNKRELWTHQKLCDTTKLRARTLLISPDSKKQIVDGRLLLSKLIKQGIMKSIDFTKKQAIIDGLNSVLNLTEGDWLERRLQYRIFSMGMAQDVHQARCMIYHKHVAVRGSVVNKPGFLVKADDEPFIEIYAHSSKANPEIKSRRARKAGTACED